jgi:hypothetical protein
MLFVNVSKTIVKRTRLGAKTQVILQACQTLSLGHAEWDKEGSSNASIISASSVNATGYREYLDILHSEHDKASEWVASNLADLGPYSLISAHIRFGIFREKGETSISASKFPNYEFEVEGYFAEWPKMLKALLCSKDVFRKVERDLGDQECELPAGLVTLYFDAWVTMLFRACC